MFERLRKLRGELERMTPRYVEITTKYEDLKSKIHEEEVTEVIGIVDKVYRCTGCHAAFGFH